MIVQCDTKAHAVYIIEQINKIYSGSIVNCVINEHFEKVLLILNGQIDAVDKDFFDGVGAKVLFNSSEGNELFFVNNSQYCNRDNSTRDALLRVIAGPCEIESYEDLKETALSLKKMGVSVFRAMPEKPRTSPYNFQGIGKKGFEFLARIKDEVRIPILAEVFCQEDIELAISLGIDMLQIGARNMQNYDLIKRVASSGLPTVLKKGMWCNNGQLLKAAEYFFVYGSGNVILCERGIQSLENSTRNTLDLSSLLYLKKNSLLPIMVDASHGTGVREFVIPMNCAAVLLGADLIEVEVHVDPEKTIKPGDYYQMLNIQQYGTMLEELKKVMSLVGKSFDWEI